MKKILTAILFCAAIGANAQVAVNTDGSGADASAMLDVKSTTKGMLVPRVTTVQRTTTIANPADGLLVYDTDTKGFWYYKAGTGWVSVTAAGNLVLPYAASQASASTPLFSLNNTSATGNALGIYGTSASTTGGSGAASGATAVMGEMLATSGGGFSAGVRGINRSTTGLGIGVIGYQAGSGYGTYGESPSGYGLVGTSSSGYGLYATSSSGTAAYLSSSSGLALIAGAGAVLINNSLTAGRSTAGSGNNGVNGYSTVGIGVYGNSSASNGAGVLAEGAYIGVQGTTTGTSTARQAVRGDNGGSSTGYAGFFSGNVSIAGTLSKTAGSFQIDHPLDPENKYLIHSFVESPDMKNIYDGIVTTGANGETTVTMPDWFQSLNIDFRYQLTCIGTFAQAIVLKEMEGNKFTIKTNQPNVKVSWQVTGTRNDPYAKDHRLPVEKMKRDDEKGKYIYPQGYGKGPESSLSIIRGITKEEKH